MVVTLQELTALGVGYIPLVEALYMTTPAARAGRVAYPQPGRSAHPALQRPRYAPGVDRTAATR